MHLHTQAEQWQARLVLPLVKLTNRPNASVSDLGTPEQLLQRIGAFITGDLAASCLMGGPLLIHGLPNPDPTITNPSNPRNLPGGG